MAALSVQYLSGGILTLNSICWMEHFSQGRIGRDAAPHNDLLGIELLGGFHGLGEQHLHHGLLKTGCHVGDRQGGAVLFELLHFPQYRGFQSTE